MSPRKPKIKTGPSMIPSCFISNNPAITFGLLSGFCDLVTKPSTAPSRPIPRPDTNRPNRMVH